MGYFAEHFAQSTQGSTHSGTHEKLGLADVAARIQPVAGRPLDASAAGCATASFNANCVGTRCIPWTGGTGNQAARCLYCGAGAGLLKVTAIVSGKAEVLTDGGAGLATRNKSARDGHKVVTKKSQVLKSAKVRTDTAPPQSWGGQLNSESVNACSQTVSTVVAISSHLVSRVVSTIALRSRSAKRRNKNWAALKSRD